MEVVRQNDGNLEIDTLTNGKPVELILSTEVMWLEFPFVPDQPGRRVEDIFQSSHEDMCGCLGNTVQALTASMQINWWLLLNYSCVRPQYQWHHPTYATEIKLTLS